MTESETVSSEELEEALRNLFAIERDRLQGYQTSELHMDPYEALSQAEDVLVQVGYHPDDLILPAEREKLGL